VSRLAVAGGAAAVVVCAGAVVAAASAPTTLGNATRRPTVVAVSSTALVCPGAALPERGSSRVFVATPAELPEPAMADGPVGTVTVGGLTGSVAPLASVRGPGESSVANPPDVTGPVVVAGSGNLAAGLAAVQWSGGRHAGTRPQRAPATAPVICPQPGAEWWFHGVDTAVGTTSTLVLTNPDPAVAVADIAFYGPQGEVDAPASRGFALAPESTRTYDLARFAPALDTLSLVVRADQGRVVAAVRETTTEPASPRDTRWVPAAPTPARHVVVDPAPASTAQTLAITNPGARDALVQVQVMDSDGTFVPTGLGDVQVPPGTVETSDLLPATHGAPAAVRLTSTEPVGGAVVSTTKGKRRGSVVATTSPGLRDPAVVPMLTGTQVSLVFAGGSSGRSSVSVEAVDARGAVHARRSLQVDDGLTLWSPHLPRRVAYLLVTVTSGRGVHGVASYRSAAALSTLPVVSGRYTVTRPAVSPAPTP
jgi:hypothetical protein